MDDGIVVNELTLLNSTNAAALVVFEQWDVTDECGDGLAAISFDAIFNLSLDGHLCWLLAETEFVNDCELKGQIVPVG
jgi:hypothetical protein